MHILLNYAYFYFILHKKQCSSCLRRGLSQTVFKLHVLSELPYVICCICSAEPVRPIDPAAWISHTTALTGPYPHYGKDNQPTSPSHTRNINSVLIMTTSQHFNNWEVLLTNSSPAPEFDDLPLSASKTDMATIVKVMQLPDSGLEIRDRMWLKITIANAVIGVKSWALWAHTKLKANTCFLQLKIQNFF